MKTMTRTSPKRAKNIVPKFCTTFVDVYPIFSKSPFTAEELPNPNIFYSIESKGITLKFAMSTIKE
jgi:hypothetical protein